MDPPLSAKDAIRTPLRTPIKITLERVSSKGIEVFHRTAVIIRETKRNFGTLARVSYQTEKNFSQLRF